MSACSPILLSVRLSVGNAAWPMGVTMVGIHERAAREKINQSQIARTFLSCHCLPVLCVLLRFASLYFCVIYLFVTWQVQMC